MRLSFLFPNIKTCENVWSNFSENLRIVRGIKIARVNSIHITKYINLQLFTLILYGIGVLRCYLHVPAVTISMGAVISMCRQ